MSVNIIICGGRWVQAEEHIHRYIDYLHERYGDDLVIISGGATGADTIATDYAKSKGIPTVIYEANWGSCGPDCPPVCQKVKVRSDGQQSERYCPRAGYRRNHQMLAHEGGIHGVAAFIDRPLKQSRGTNHMVSIAQEAGVPTRVIQVPRVYRQGDRQVFAAPRLREGEKMLHVELNFATFGLVVKDGVITYTPPIARYAKGWSVERAQRYFGQRRGGKVQLLDPASQAA